jgi:hypothetical protein
MRSPPEAARGEAPMAIMMPASDQAVLELRVINLVTS